MADHPIEAPPRPLSDAERAERAEQMYELHAEIVSGLAEGRAAMWRVCKALSEFVREHGWSADGLNYDSLSGWLADPEVGITRTTCYRMIRAYEETVVVRQIPMATLQEADYTKVDLVLAKVKAGKVDVEEALADAKELGWRDLREKYRIPPDAVPDPRDYSGEDEDDVPALAHDGSTSQSQNGSADIEVDGVVVEPTQNGDDVLGGLGHRLAAFLLWVWEEQAPEHKKRMGAERRATLQALIEQCRDEGWLDASDV